MPVTIIRDRAPLCRTCRQPLMSWHFGCDDHSERCDRCEKRSWEICMRLMLRNALRRATATDTAKERTT